MDNFREQMFVGYFSFGNLLNLILVIKYLVILHNSVNASVLSLRVRLFLTRSAARRPLPSLPHQREMDRPAIKTRPR